MLSYGGLMSAYEHRHQKGCHAGEVSDITFSVSEA